MKDTFRLRFTSLLEMRTQHQDVNPSPITRNTALSIILQSQLEPQPTLSLFQLLLHVDAGALPQDLGGALDYDHQDWLTKCNQVAELQVRLRRKF